MVDVFRSTHALLKMLSIAPIVGRKRLQKTVHLLKVSGAPFPYPFQYHHFGPYAHTLQEAIDRLVEDGLVEERTGPDGYEYRLTERGRSFLARLEADGYRFPIDAELYRSLIAEPASFLEVLSTYAYFRQAGLAPEAAEAKVAALKPHLAALLPAAAAAYAARLEGRAGG
ncbi:hypothetical protein AB1399_04250 [Hydrogenibacillus schlegelii]|uniref:PadR family transcriptional regulator n=1 Tax=Hydrogenibacillus schlegelii TaxID=1484 RepID=A0A179ITM9_HYDSH|nr:MULTISPECIES: hypothetical protein [Hydrogenibacillus]OAR04971.1 hypothetical protein SA87_10270 [Hydrogenibacillus schlegelii]QZA32845.1 hypothetical protein K2M58_11445 [Hydrogenibacillus sp. N12]